MKQQFEYISDVFRLVTEIGERAGVADATLYRSVDNKFVRLTKDNIRDEGSPAYTLPVPAGYTYRTLFVVASGLQDGTQKLVNYITSFYITPFPGCCALCISTTAKVYDPYKNRGINKLGLALREALAGVAGYTGVVCTDVDHNTYSVRTLANRNFQKLYGLRNKRTANRLSLYIKELE